MAHSHAHAVSASPRSRRETITYWVTLGVALLLLLAGYWITGRGQSLFGVRAESELLRARVTAVRGVADDDYALAGAQNDFTMIKVTFDARVLSGASKGKSLRCVQEIDSMYALETPRVRVGDTVLLDQFATEAGTQYVLTEYVRTTPLLWLGALFAVLVILFGRRKGVNTLLSFGLALVAIFLVLVPAVLSGRNIYGWSLGVCVFIVLTNLLLVHGLGSKSLTAALGCFGGVLCSGLVMLLMHGPVHVTGQVDEESIMLKALGIDIKATVFCMIMIGSVGALMDVAMDIAAALHELHEQDPTLSRAKLLQSGLRIGQDLIGTMVNTLVLAYIGSSLGALLVLFTASPNATLMLNKEMIAVEILQSLAGCLSVLAVVPLTSVAAVTFLKKYPVQTQTPAAPPTSSQE